MARSTAKARRPQHRDAHARNENGRVPDFSGSRPFFIGDGLSRIGYFSQERQMPVTLSVQVGGDLKVKHKWCLVTTAAPAAGMESKGGLSRTEPLLTTPSSDQPPAP